MITKLLSALKQWAFPSVVIYTILITTVSLIHLGEIPSLGSSFDDKIYHCIAYFVYTVIVYNYVRLKSIFKPILISAFSVVIYGIIIEVLQNAVTSYRTLDGYDILANALGVCIAVMILKFRDKLKLK